MEAITVKELLAAVHGELLQGEGTAKILGVNTDSRTVKAGEVFWPRGTVRSFLSPLCR